MKIGITLDDNLVDRMDEYANANYMSRSGLISLSVSQFLNAAEVTKSISDIALCMRKIADTGTIDEETRRELEDFERLSKMLVGK